MSWVKVTSRLPWKRFYCLILTEDVTIFEFALRSAAIILGIILVAVVLSSAIRTFVLPRGVQDKLSRRTFQFVRVQFDMRADRVDTYLERDRIMALYAPVALLSLPVMWLSIVMVGYLGIFWALRGRGALDAMQVSGSSLCDESRPSFNSPSSPIPTFLSIRLPWRAKNTMTWWPSSPVAGYR